MTNLLTRTETIAALNADPTVLDHIFSPFQSSTDFVIARDRDMDKEARIGFSVELDEIYGGDWYSLYTTPTLALLLECNDETQVFHGDMIVACQTIEKLRRDDRSKALAL